MSPCETRMSVPLSKECRVLSGKGSIEALSDVWPEGATHAVLICDANVLRLHGDRVLQEIRKVSPGILTLPFEPGEGSKDAATAAGLQEAMFQSRIDREGIVVAFGGGVAMDLAGFVASTYMRGLPVLNLPTTLLAAVDAGIGGKTGINNRFGKNLLGTFHWPVAVLVETGFLDTLPTEEVRCGLAETVKAGVVADATILEDLEASADALAGGALPSSEVIGRALGVKVHTVVRDPCEAGERRILNFGHTAGHGIEAATSLEIRHGDAVAAGMIVEGRVACRLTGFPPEDQQRLESLLKRLGLITRPPCRFDAALPAMIRDKKNREGRIRLALPRRLGLMEASGGKWVVEAEPEVVEACWNG